MQNCQTEQPKPVIMLDTNVFYDFCHVLGFDDFGFKCGVNKRVDYDKKVSKGLVQDDPSFQSGSDVPVPLTPPVGRRGYRSQNKSINLQFVSTYREKTR